MTHEADTKFLEKLEAFKTAAYELLTVWQSLDHTGDFYAQDYPFAKSFDEVFIDICEWLNTQEH